MFQPLITKHEAAPIPQQSIDPVDVLGAEDNDDARRWIMARLADLTFWALAQKARPIRLVSTKKTADRQASTVLHGMQRAVPDSLVSWNFEADLRLSPGA
jgi:hypothetical protein